ncbi:MAG: alpha/beta hydrolase [Burkholderiales bacterium]|nr:alpha/beta hydrolase [Burkholderiales bacterium]
MLEHIELTTGPDPKGTIIWMHGLGADGWDFVSIVKELQLPDDLPLRFIFPHAPTRPVTINNGYVMRAWYDISMAELQRLPDERGIRESQQQIEELLEREYSRGVASDKIVLAGFSQGGAIALQTGLRHAKPLAGVMALSTYLTLADSLAAEASATNKNIPILMVHGSQDPIIPLALAEQSRDTLKQHGYGVRWHDYPMPHSVCMEEVEVIAEWLVDRYKSRILLA